MKLEPAHIARFEQFLETIGSQTYPEPPSVVDILDITFNLAGGTRRLPGVHRAAHLIGRRT